jgi:hypothetical protein
MSFGVCSWNAKSLAHHDHKIRRQKLNELSSLLKRFDVVVIVEAHGSDFLFKQILKDMPVLITSTPHSASMTVNPNRTLEAC